MSARVRYYAPSGGGGGGSSAVPTLMTQGAGNAGADYSTTSNAFVNVDNAVFPIAIPAVAGDILEVIFTCSTYANAGVQFIEFAVNIGGTDYKLSNHETSASASGITPFTGVLVHTVLAGEVAGGNVQCQPRWQSASGAQVNMMNSGGYPPRFSVKNLRH